MSTDPKRCTFTAETSQGPMRCLVAAPHPGWGHTCSADLDAPAMPLPVPSAQEG